MEINNNVFVFHVVITYQFSIVKRFFPNVFAPFILGNMFLYASAFFRQGSLLGRQDLGFGWFWGSPWIPIQDPLYFHEMF